MAVAEPVASPTPRRDSYYSFTRCWNGYGHWRCCVVDNKLPNSCGVAEYREAGERRRGSSPGSDTSSARASAVKADLLQAWRDLGDSASPHYKIGLARYIPAVMDIGPRPWAENDDEWYERRLDWFIVHRWRFGPLPAERYLALTDDAVRQVSWILGWRP